MRERTMKTLEGMRGDLIHPLTLLGYRGFITVCQCRGGGEGCGKVEGDKRLGEGGEGWGLRDKARGQICLSGPEWVLPAQEKRTLMS